MQLIKGKTSNRLMRDFRRMRNNVARVGTYQHGVTSAYVTTSDVDQ